MDADVLVADGDGNGRLTGEGLERTLAANADAPVFAVVATAGATNTGVIDDLAGIAGVCAARGLWFHVDAAYGGAALAAPSKRRCFDGIERADSLVVDPHKWLFAPFDCAALLYRDPAIARPPTPSTRRTSMPSTSSAGWNPSTYAFHLTRRARGLPFWFSLATHGTRRYAEAIEDTLSPHPGRGACDRGSPPARAGDGAGAVGGAVSPPGLGAGRLPGVERSRARRGPHVHRPDFMEGRDRCCAFVS